MKKTLVILFLMLAFCCIFAFSVGAKTVVSEKNIDENGDIIAELISRVESNDERHICSVDITYTTISGETKISKIYYLIGLWAQQNKRQIEAIYLPDDFEMSQTVYFFDKIDVDGDGQYGSDELIKGTYGGGFGIYTYTTFNNNIFEGIVDVKRRGVQAISYSKYLTYFGGNTFSKCAALNSVTYNGCELEEYACIISPSVETIMAGTFGGDGNSLDKNSVSSNFTKLVFADRTGSLSLDQYCFTRNELVEIVFGSGRYALNGSDRIALLYKTENSNEYCLERVIVSKDTVIASGSISWCSGEYDVIVLGLESESASAYEANCKNALPNAKSVTYDPCYYGHTESLDDGDCTTAVLCVACGVFQFKAAQSHVDGARAEYSNYFENGYYYRGCQNEGCTVGSMTVLDPLVTYFGYSYTTFDTTVSVVQGYKINKEAVEKYIGYNPSFELGVVAAVNATNDYIAPDLDGAGVVHDKIYLKSNYVEIAICGIPKDRANVNFIFCLYAKDNGSIRFLDNGTTQSKIIGISFDQIKTLQ